MTRPRRRPRRQAPPPRRARGDGPRRPDRHDRRGHHRHAGPAHGQARPGPGVPRRRHRPRRPLLHVPPRHGHGDEHARGLRADELGDRLRRLDRRAGLGPAPRPALAPGDGDGPRRRRSTRRPAQEIPVSPRTILKRQVARAAAMPASRSRPARSSSTTSSRTRGRSWPSAAGRSRSRSATTTRTTTSSRRPRPSRSIACCATR